MDEMRVNEGEGIQLKCVGKYGNLLQEVTVLSTKGNELKHVFDNSVSKFEPFYIMVEGKDPSGKYFQIF